MLLPAHIVGSANQNYFLSPSSSTPSPPPLPLHMMLSLLPPSFLSTSLLLIAYYLIRRSYGRYCRFRTNLLNTLTRGERRDGVRRQLSGLHRREGSYGVRRRLSGRRGSSIHVILVRESKNSSSGVWSASEERTVPAVSDGGTLGETVASDEGAAGGTVPAASDGGGTAASGVGAAEGKDTAAADGEGTAASGERAAEGKVTAASDGEEQQHPEKGLRGGQSQQRPVKGPQMGLSRGSRRCPSGNGSYLSRVVTRRSRSCVPTPRSGAITGEMTSDTTRDDICPC
ncbi:hypothetical protein OS493_016898 [Desmophyllum pertusum]|uniref:Uncharacterized protein n=1 Tax=Desmophyllum pertusum TaxID=174260 RepID=A0A9W9YNW5_9CNID|nr:hypothetical protein OS493_016898 [Desmophyllum pertusum]